MAKTKKINVKQAEKPTSCSCPLEDQLNCGPVAGGMHKDETLYFCFKHEVYNFIDSK
jgi:hypothetical protein